MRPHPSDKYQYLQDNTTRIFTSRKPQVRVTDIMDIFGEAQHDLVRSSATSQFGTVAAARGLSSSATLFGRLTAKRRTKPTKQPSQQVDCRLEVRLHSDQPVRQFNGPVIKRFGRSLTRSPNSHPTSSPSVAVRLSDSPVAKWSGS